MFSIAASRVFHVTVSRETPDCAIRNLSGTRTGILLSKVRQTQRPLQPEARSSVSFLFTLDNPCSWLTHATRDHSVHHCGGVTPAVAHGAASWSRRESWLTRATSHHTTHHCSEVRVTPAVTHGTSLVEVVVAFVGARQLHRVRVTPAVTNELVWLKLSTLS